MPEGSVPPLPNLRDLYGLHGKCVVVTGGGAGIGKGIAWHMAAAGASLVLADINGEGARQAAAEITSATRGGVEPLSVETNVADEASVARMFEAATQRFGGVDVLVNNAGVTMKCPFPEVSLEEWDRIHSINLRGVFICMREAVRHMKPRGKGGAIVNISSISSVHVGAFGNSTYGASKAGVNTLTQSVALEYAPDGIRVNAILPGRIDVERNIKARATQTIGGPFTEPHRIPLGRPGKPDDIAAAALFLASPAAAYITGHLLPVDGGFLLS